MVEVYSTENCYYCKKTKAYLKAHNIVFKESNVTNNIGKRTEMIKKSNGLSVPVIDADGEIIIGFNKLKLDKLIEKYGKRNR